MRHLFTLTYLICLVFATQRARAQHMQVVFDQDAQGRMLAKLMPMKVAEIGDTSLFLEARYGYENNFERFRFIFTVKHPGSTFIKSPDHTTLQFFGEQDTTFTVPCLEPMSYAADELSFHFIFTAGDLGFEDNDLSLQRLGGVTHLLIHQLPEMDLLFALPKEKYPLLKDIQYSLRQAYREGDMESAGGSALRGSTGKEKSNRDQNADRHRGERLKL